MAIFLYLIWEWKVVWYGINQGIGQSKVIVKARPIEDFLDNANVADSVKYKIKLIQEIKQYTVDYLGFDKSGSYEKMYDQEGKPVLWVVTASKPFQLEAYEWSFSFLGNFNYKGHFEREKALKDSIDLVKEHYDIDIGEVSAWSTLGWLDDPILSSMLKKSEGALANLIIHELMHGTLYIKNDVNFNENLANFVGHKGALMFLEHKWGKKSKQYIDYINAYVDKEIFYKHILKKAEELNQIYSLSTFQDLSLEKKIKQKKAFIENLKEGMYNIEFKGARYSPDQLNDWHPNNSFFIGYLMYNAEQEDFEKEYQEIGDLKKFVEHLKEKYNSL